MWGRGSALADLVQVVAQPGVCGPLAPVGDLRIDAERFQRGVPQHLLHQPDVAVGGLEKGGGSGVARRVGTA
jgi:hypothetical protein